MKYSFLFFYLLIAFISVKTSRMGFITGGSYTSYDKYPHSILLTIQCGYDFLCGGSILNQDIILTAAHCMEVCETQKNIIVGIKYGHERRSYMKTTYMRYYMIHQEFDSEQMDNDICLMSTKNRLQLGNVAKRVILMKNPPTAKFAYIAGWGVNENNVAQLTLKHTSAAIQPRDVCLMMRHVPEGSFCAGPLTGFGSADMGDSGSALVVDEYIQIGLVSFKVRKYSLVSYTNVSYHLGWIERNSKRLACV